MIATIIAYAMCLLCCLFAGCSLMLSFSKKGTESVVALGLFFAFGIVGWGFAFLGSLT
jgi:hypothetical protein